VDAVVEQLIPPISVPVMLAGAVLGGSLLLRARLAAALAGFSLAGQLGYILAGLALVEAPWRVYRALAYAPAYVGWKAWLYGRSLGARGAAPWVRTARTPSATQSSRRSTGDASTRDQVRAVEDKDRVFIGRLRIRLSQYGTQPPCHPDEGGISR